MTQEIKSVLQTLYNIVVSEEAGNTERILEYFSSEELKEVMKVNHIPIECNLCDEDIQEAISDYLSDTGTTKVNKQDAYEWLKKTDLNSAAKERFLILLQRAINSRKEMEKFGMIQK